MTLAVKAKESGRCLTSGRSGSVFESSSACGGRLGYRSVFRLQLLDGQEGDGNRFASRILSHCDFGIVTVPRHRPLTDVTPAYVNINYQGKPIIQLFSNLI